MLLELILQVMVFYLRKPRQWPYNCGQRARNKSYAYSITSVDFFVLSFVWGDKLEWTQTFDLTLLLVFHFYSSNTAIFGSPNHRIKYTIDQRNNVGTLICCQVKACGPA